MEGYRTATLSKDDPDRIIVAFQYDPLLVEKVKTIPGRKWHPNVKHWSFPSSDGTLERILKAHLIHIYFMFIEDGVR